MISMWYALSSPNIHQFIFSSSFQQKTTQEKLEARLTCKHNNVRDINLFSIPPRVEAEAEIIYFQMGKITLSERCWLE